MRCRCRTLASKNEIGRKPPAVRATLGNFGLTGWLMTVLAGPLLETSLEQNNAQPEMPSAVEIPQAEPCHGCSDIIMGRLVAHGHVASSELHF